ncbi:MAG: hypothetical protein CM15mP17_00040 [Gammaproteobacteria bacterium]|nr:MAG: hypothetical protein CM15mP17_00040 [Gammaproteobacteria bacterium]
MIMVPQINLLKKLRKDFISKFNSAFPRILDARPEIMSGNLKRSWNIILFLGRVQILILKKFPLINVFKNNPDIGYYRIIRAMIQLSLMNQRVGR